MPGLVTGHSVAIACGLGQVPTGRPGLAVRVTVGAAVRSAIRASVSSAIRATVSSAIRATVSSAIRTTVSSAIAADTGAAVGTAVGTTILDAGNTVRTAVGRSLEAFGTAAGTVGRFAHRSSISLMIGAGFDAVEILLHPSSDRVPGGSAYAGPCQGPGLVFGAWPRPGARC